MAERAARIPRDSLAPEIVYGLLGNKRHLRMRRAEDRQAMLMMIKMMLSKPGFNSGELKQDELGNGGYRFPTVPLRCVIIVHRH